MGSSTGLEDCASKCTNLSNCISFEFWPIGQAHPTQGVNYCQLSSSCIPVLSVQASNSDPSDMYVKDVDAGGLASYTRYPMRGCTGRNELYMGSSTGLQDCASKCTDLSNCISFEFWPIGQAQ